MSREKLRRCDFCFVRLIRLLLLLGSVFDSLATSLPHGWDDAIYSLVLLGISLLHVPGVGMMLLNDSRAFSGYGLIWHTTHQPLFPRTRLQPGRPMCVARQNRRSDWLHTSNGLSSTGMALLLGSEYSIARMWGWFELLKHVRVEVAIDVGLFSELSLANDVQTGVVNPGIVMIIRQH